jgi:copper chaperone CopZ
MKKIKLKVNGMHCNGCATKIKSEISNLSAEANVEVNLDNHLVTVSTDNLKSAEIKNAIIGKGFQVESVEIE